MILSADYRTPRPLPPRSFGWQAIKTGLRQAFWGVMCAVVLLTSPALAQGPDPAETPSEPALLSAYTTWSAEQARAGEGLILTIVVRIAEGVHINADAGQIAVHESIIPYPTRVEILEIVPPAEVGVPVFPPAHGIEVGFSAQPWAVFDGQVEIAIPIEAPPEVTADVLTLRLALRYQGCDAISCWLPETLHLTTRLPLTSRPQP